MTTSDLALRERKKHATRVALREAALRLALERGPENVRVNEIADAAGVSPRTYNNYFSSREQAIIAAVTADREQRIVDALLAQPEDLSLSEAVISAIIEHYTDSGDQPRDVLLMITTSPGLRDLYAHSTMGTEYLLADALSHRVPGIDQTTAQVLAASVGAAARVAVQSWLASVAGSASATGFVIPAGSLPDHMRAALTPLAPALDAAAGRSITSARRTHR